MIVRRLQSTTYLSRSLTDFASETSYFDSRTDSHSGANSNTGVIPTLEFLYCNRTNCNSQDDSDSDARVISEIGVDFGIVSVVDSGTDFEHGIGFG